jgi:hypothetical protein
VVGATLGPLGVIAAAMLSPLALHAARRLREFAADVRRDGLDEEALRRLLEEDERLADLVARALRSAVESDLGAKRKLLARAVRRALEDDAVVDVEDKIVRAAAAIDTTDVRVLVIIDAYPDDRRRMPRRHLAHEWPGVTTVASAAYAALQGVGLIQITEIRSRGRTSEVVQLTPFGREVLERLLAGGLRDELDFEESAGDAAKDDLPRA